MIITHKQTYFETFVVQLERYKNKQDVAKRRSMDKHANKPADI